MIKKVQKSRPLKGEITIPADKSISHRAIMLASLAKGKSIISNFSSGQDCHTTMNIFKQLGVKIKQIDRKTIEIVSDSILKPANPSSYFAGNSGTTTRLLAGILACQDFDSTITGDKSLSKRPMKRIIEPLTLMGAKIDSTEGKLPLNIHGHKLHGITYTMPVASAQVKSAILLAGLKAEGNTTVIETAQSRNHTELMLKHFGADIKTDKNKITLSPSELTAKNIEVVGDISSASFFIAAGLIVPNSDITIKNVGLNPTRTGIIDIVERMGGGISIINRKNISGEECGDIKVAYNDSLKACTIEGADIPRLIDELPIIAVLASQAKGTTIVKNAEDLRNKETDRIKCLVCELNKIGIDIQETDDGFIINGGKKLTGGVEVESYCDHRLAMSFYIAGLICEKEISINGFEWINISFPEFETQINALK
ncbi:MAG: 3-phosphoshikimate 1-carboxyvinyltransferase [bacterium]|nr:3-phosphoshikimate 1-carboxyvinyltransferase [bacterium]